METTVSEQPNPAPLRLVPGGTESGTAGRHSAAPVPPQAPASVPGAALVPVSAARRATGAVAKAAGELWLHPDRLAHSAWTGKTESLAEHFAYVKSRAWVPPELEGRKAAAITLAGFAYHVVIAWPLKAAAKTVDAAASRPLLLACLAAFVLLLYLIVKGIL